MSFIEFWNAEGNCFVAILQEGDYMAIVDVKSGYRAVPFFFFTVL